jgi:hypothetical protein
VGAFGVWLFAPPPPVRFPGSALEKSSGSTIFYKETLLIFLKYEEKHCTTIYIITSKHSLLW